ncbi:hypothetical protein GCM10009612_72410 [Streptomyces beijiangensis]
MVDLDHGCRIYCRRRRRATPIDVLWGHHGPKTASAPVREADRRVAKQDDFAHLPADALPVLVEPFGHIAQAQAVIEGFSKYVLSLRIHSMTPEGSDDRNSRPFKQPEGQVGGQRHSAYTGRG